MHSAFESAMNELMAEFDKTRTEMVRMHKNMGELTGVAKSKRRQLSVTVDARGDIVELKFHGESYRTLPPTELAQVIVQTIREARESVQAQVWESAGGGLPAGAELADVVSGHYDWSEPLSDALTLPDTLLELLTAAAPKDSFGDPDAVTRAVAEAVDVAAPPRDDRGEAATTSDSAESTAAADHKSQE